MLRGFLKMSSPVTRRGGGTQNSKLVRDIAVHFSYGVAGQGSAERLNKFVANMYTPARNRQSYEMTQAFVRVKYHVLESRMRTAEKRPKATFAKGAAEDEHDTPEEEEELLKKHGFLLAQYETRDVFAPLADSLDNAQQRAYDRYTTEYENLRRQSWTESGWS